MTSSERWKKAQLAENEFWSGLSPTTIQQSLDFNEAAAELLQSWLPEVPSPALEIGLGALGVGMLGFFPSIPVRFGVDPLPLVAPVCSEALRQKVFDLRRAIHFIQSCGESLPFADESVGLAVCYNVLDHVNDPNAVVQQIYRVLRPGGSLFLMVDTFSYLGLVKWHLWTKRRHANEILVRAHPHRFLERHVEKICKQAGFQIERTMLHRPLDRWVGHSLRSTFLLRKSL
jgi:SAM-dependent methyltransferase